LALVGQGRIRAVGCAPPDWSPESKQRLSAWLGLGLRLGLGLARVRAG